MSISSALVLVLIASERASAFRPGARTSTHSPLSITFSSRSPLYAQLIEETKDRFSARESIIPRFPFPKSSQDEANTAANSIPSTKGSVSSLTVSLVKQIVGAGVLALPAAVAALGDDPSAVLPVALPLIGLMGAINAYYFSIMGHVCASTGASTFASAWERTVGPGTTPFVAGMISFKTLLSCLCYSMILGDSFQSLAVTFGWDHVSTAEALLAVTGTALLPLCLLKDLSSLAPFSLAGICGFAATAAAMSVRMTDGSYNVAPLDTPSVGRFIQDLADPMIPNFGHGAIDGMQGLVLACTLATAFVSHYNAPRFHAELDDKSQFDTVTVTSFSISAAMMAFIAVTGYCTFGIASQPMILANYSPYDPLLTGCRAAIAASLVATFPLPFVGLRDGVLDALQVSKETRNDDLQMSALTVGLLAVITGLALSVHDLSLLLSVGGGTISTAVSSVLPTMMYRASVAQQKSPNTKKPIRSQSSSSKSTLLSMPSFDQTTFATSLMGVCVATGLTGVALALQSHFG
jgi:amino acid permease